MKQSTKRSAILNSLYCGRCFIRLGIGERRLVRDGKAYHQDCYAKLELVKKEPESALPVQVREH